MSPFYRMSGESSIAPNKSYSIKCYYIYFNIYITYKFYIYIWKPKKKGIGSIQPTDPFTIFRKSYKSFFYYIYELENYTKKMVLV